MSNGSSPQANLDLVTRMYACFNSDDMDTIRREIFAPDLVWNLPGHHPLSGTKNGSEEVIQFFLALRRANIRVTLDPAADPATGIDTFGDSTVVEVHRGQGEITVERRQRRLDHLPAQRAQLHPLPRRGRPDRPGPGLHQRPAHGGSVLQRRLPVEADPRSSGVLKHRN